MSEETAGNGIGGGVRTKVALVTGSTRGIGRAIATRLLQEGARVAVTGQSAASVDRALEALGPHPELFGIAADVSNFEQVRQMVAAVLKRFGTVDILVNSAGLGIFGAVADLTPAQWEKMISVNLSGAYYCCHEVLPIFRSGGGGDVINISSLAGSNAFAGGAGYNASKFGLNGFSEAMMQDYRNDGVRVSYIMPGSVDTEFNGRSPSGPTRDFGGRIAPEDVAEVVVALLGMPRRTTVSRIEMRPSRPPRK